MKLDAAAVRALNLLPNPLDGTVLPLDIFVSSVFACACGNGMEIIQLDMELFSQWAAYNLFIAFILLKFPCDILPFNSHEWPRQNFSSVNTSDENKGKCQLGDY